MRRLTQILFFISAGALLLAGLAVAAAPHGSRSNPVPKHTSFSIPSSKGWHLRVNSAVTNANQMVVAENQFNDKPAAGRQFFIINVTATYRGSGKSDSYSGLRMQALGRSSVAYDYSDHCGVIPNEFDELKDVFTGGSLSGNICFSVKTSDVASLLLMVEPGFSFDETMVFFRTR